MLLRIPAIRGVMLLRRHRAKEPIARAFLEWALPCAGEEARLTLGVLGGKTETQTSLAVTEVQDRLPSFFDRAQHKVSGDLTLSLDGADPKSWITASVMARGRDEWPGYVPLTHIIDLDRPHHWSTSPKTLKDGRVSGPPMLVDLVRRLASAAPVEIQLLAEQEVHNPISCHLVFHSDPRDFLVDLVEVVRLGLRGGAHYSEYDGSGLASLKASDPRSSYRPIVGAPDDDSAYFVFLARKKAARDALRDALATLGPLVDEHGIPPDLDAAWVREQLRQAPNCVVFESDDGGLGVHDFPFLEATYLDGPYLTLLRAVAARLADRSSDPG